MCTVWLNNTGNSQGTLALIAKNNQNIRQANFHARLVCSSYFHEMFDAENLFYPWSVSEAAGKIV